jgi:tRNA pseudouridine-54 N-methylase
MYASALTHDGAAHAVMNAVQLQADEKGTSVASVDLHGHANPLFAVGTHTHSERERERERVVVYGTCVQTWRQVPVRRAA